MIILPHCVVHSTFILIFPLLLTKLSSYTGLKIYTYIYITGFSVSDPAPQHL